MRSNAIGIMAASALLASCSMMSGGDTPGVSAPAGAMRDSSSGSLLYVSGRRGTIDIFSYPGLKPVSAITGLGQPSGECVDALGNVWVADYGASKIVEYAHGAKKPTRTLTIDFPYYCAIDQTSGNIAVLGHGNLAIFSNAQGPPVFYSFPQTGSPLCAYDNSGDLFVEADVPRGGYHKYELLELRIGAKKLRTVTFMGLSPLGGGSMLWDGSELVFGKANVQTQGSERDFYHVRVSGKEAVITETTALSMPRVIRAVSAISQYTVVGSAILGPKAASGRSDIFAVWNYPNGGKWLTIRRPGIGRIMGVALSP
jgi:hypothetical protein